MVYPKTDSISSVDTYTCSYAVYIVEGPWAAATYLGRVMSRNLIHVGAETTNTFPSLS